MPANRDPRLVPAIQRAPDAGGWRSGRAAEGTGQEALDGMEVDGQEQEQGKGRKGGAESAGRPAGEEALRAARHNAGAAEAAGAGRQGSEESAEDQLSVIEAQKQLLDQLLGECCIAYTDVTREGRLGCLYTFLWGDCSQ